MGEIAETASSRHRWIWPVTLTALLVLASGTNPATPPVTFVGFDKLAHFGLFGLLATLVLRTPRLWRLNGWRGWIVVLAVSAFGGTDEWHQSFIPGRSVEWADWIADTSGAALAVVLYLRWTWYRRLLEARIGRSRRQLHRATAEAVSMAIP